jgi:uncharacterized membrane protein YfcA
VATPAGKPNSPQSKSSNLITLISVTVLIGTEVFAVALASGWAIAGLFELGDVVSYVLMGIFAALGAYIMVRFVQNARQIEALN